MLPFLLFQLIFRLLLELYVYASVVCWLCLNLLTEVRRGCREYVLLPAERL